MGWWYYFPFLFLTKTPIPLLILLILGTGRLLKERRFEPALWIPPAAFFLIACASKVQIGHRHILAIYPFLFTLAGAALPKEPTSTTKRHTPLLLFIIWQAWTTLQCHPDHLAYFNELVGGSDHAYEIASDSNVDWGQGLKALGRYVHDHEMGPIYLSYFGAASPRYYGIECVDICPVMPVLRTSDRIGPFQPLPRYFAVSATNYQHTYFQNKTTLSWLHERKPSKIIRKSILVFDLGQDVEAHKKMSGLLGIMGNHELARRELELAERLTKAK